MENLSESDEIRRILWLAYGLDEIGSVPIIVQENFPFSSPSFLGCQAMPRIQCIPVVLPEGKCLKVIEFNGKSASSAGEQKVRRYEYNSTAQ